MSWTVRIVHDRSFGETRVYVVNIRDGAHDEGLYQNEDGSWKVEPLPPRDEHVKPTLTIPMRLSTEVLQGLAEELRQLGYGGLSVKGEVEAQRKHIESLERTSERFYVLANEAIKK